MRREQILEAEPTCVGFLDDCLDEFLVGAAARGPLPLQWVAVYDYWAALKDCAAQASGEQAFQRLESRLPLLVQGPLLLLPIRRRQLWDRTRDQSLVQWDHLGDAVIGVGTTGLSPEAVIYDYDRALECLELNLSASDDGQAAREALENLLLPTWLGGHTPWFCRRLGNKGP